MDIKTEGHMRPYQILSVCENSGACAELGVIMPLGVLESQRRVIHRHFTMHTARLKDVAWADLVKAATPVLAETLRPYTAGEPVVLPLVSPRELYAPVRRSDDGVFRFVYAATANNYLELERIAGKASNCIFLPPLPMKKFMELFTSTAFDAGLACLEDSAFNRCKTNTRFRDYGARGIAGVYSDMPVYSHCVRHGETGLLAANDEQSWFEAMSFLVENPGAVKRMGDAARAFTEKNYTVEASAKAWTKDILLPSLMPDWDRKKNSPGRNPHAGNT